jgi:hypothetical protein
LVGQQFYVIEATPGDYRPTGYVYVGDESGVDPRTSSAGMTVTQNLGDETEGTSPVDGSTVPYFGLLLDGEATGGATTVFVVNTLDENKVSPTGIFIDNLPYILMVGVPLVVFAGLFVARRRGNAAA